MSVRNFFQVDKLPSGEAEVFETLHRTNNLHIERIISHGQVTPPGKWYNSESDEWVILIQGKATLEYDTGEFIQMVAGDYLLIPAYQKHRVTYTSKEPHCLWLAVHFD
jgi:cupin 2 domain-containing protein